MKVLLIGPVPPPHGGISVHVMGLHRRLTAAGIPCLVLDPAGCRGKLHFARTVLRYASEGWTLHLHTNGHNTRSWLLALSCGLAGKLRSGCILTLHSGMVPRYLAQGGPRRTLAALACRLYRRVVCVSSAIRDSVGALGIDAARTEVAPACLGAELVDVPLDATITSWIATRRPLFSTALFFRPEYGFPLLVAALAELRRRHPALGCLVMGSGEQQQQAIGIIREANLQDHVLLLGDVQHEHCLALIARSNLFLRPSLEDGDSISVREALALGVPVVASRVGTRPDGVHLFEPGSVDDLLRAVDVALSAPANRVPATDGSMPRLLEIYREGDAGAPTKFNRLRTMTAREIAHRLHEKGLTECERLGLGDTIEAPAGVGFKSYLRGAPARRFYAGASESSRPPLDWVGRAVAEADALCRHRIELLNLPPVDLGPEIDWHRDPVTGHVWEKRFWADYRLEDVPAGVDPKVIHELNRHQHLPRLAKAYRFTGDERYAAEAVAQLLGWIDQNPPSRGVNWHSSLEIAIRSISWMWTLFLILPSEALDDAAAQRIGDSLFAQIQHIFRHTSLYSSPNTHLIGEAAALFIAGLVFRGQKFADHWLDAGNAVLQREAERQILDDGVHAELSSYYHCYTLDFYLQVLILARQNDFALPDAVSEKVEAMLHFLMHVTRPDGTLPLLGDDDGGRALALHQRTYRSFRDALSTGAVLFRRGDFKRQSGGFAEETALLLGEQAWDTYRRLPAQNPSSAECFFPSAGYFVQRSGWGARDSHLVFDCGGLGMLTGGHSHADALAVTLHGGGRDLLIDPGTFVYNGAPEWRRHFRATRAHNTVSVDGRDQAAMGGTFRWTSRMSTGAALREGLSMRYLEAAHDGYGPGLTHRRRLISIPNGYRILLDDFLGSGAHTFEFHFHFGAEVEEPQLDCGECSAQAWASGAGLSLALCASGPVEPWIEQEWDSQGYAEKHAARSLHVHFQAAAPASAMTFLSCAGSRPEVRRLESSSGRAIACSYLHAGYRDIAVMSNGDSQIAVEGFQMRGEFFWFRLRGDALVNFMAIGAAALRFRGSDLLEDAPCAQLAAF